MIQPSHDGNFLEDVGALQKGEARSIRRHPYTTRPKMRIRKPIVYKDLGGIQAKVRGKK